MADSTQFARYPSLAEKVVIVTGGASGIGATIVKRFAAQDARVAFFDIDACSAKELVDSIPSCKHTPVFVPTDVTKIPLLRESVQTVQQQLGPVDVLVNNAARDDRHSWSEVTPEYWDASLAVNLHHHFFCIQAVAPAMQARGRGSIINISSISWIVPSTGLPAYVAAKAAIVGITRTMSRELGPSGVRVNALLPGGIATERQRRLWYTPEYERTIIESQSLKRTLVPDDVAGLVLFLAADDSSAITGQSHIVDGGWI